MQTSPDFDTCDGLCTHNQHHRSWHSRWGTKKHRSRLCTSRYYGNKTGSTDSLMFETHLPGQRRSSRPTNPPIGGGPRPTLGPQVSLKLLFGYVTIFSSADLFTTDLNCRKKLACDIISECNVILSRRI